MKATEPRNFWVDKYTAAKTIRRRFGRESALEYLVGEKFFTFLSYAEHNSAWAAETALFVAAIRRIFDIDEIEDYLEALGRSRYRGHKKYLKELWNGDDVTGPSASSAERERIRFARMRQLLQGHSLLGSRRDKLRNPVDRDHDSGAMPIRIPAASRSPIPEPSRSVIPV